jgi:class 3 adenylate cyclase
VEEEWKTEQLAIPLIIQEAYYRTWWFWLLCGLLVLTGLYALARYRLYAIRQRERELEAQVQERTQELEAEKLKSEELLLNILPVGLAEELKEFGFAKAKRHEMVTVMFSDFKGFSRISEQLEPEALVAEIDYCFRAFDRIVEKYQLEKIKTVGDAYLCVSGINSDEDAKDAEAVIRAAVEIQQFLALRSRERKAHKLHHFEARIGVHTGPVVAGIVGIKKFAYDIWGDTVNVASRMETNGEAGKVNISETTYDLVKHQFRCTYHGNFQENSNEIGMYWIEN